MNHSTLAIAFACITSLPSWGCVNAPPAEPAPSGDGGSGGSAQGGSGAGAAIEPISCGSSTLHAAPHEQCDAMDVASDEGGCHCMMGFYWDGADCVGLGGCSCVGADCDKLAESLEECEASHASCTEAPVYACGSGALYASTHDVCDPMNVTGAGGICNCIMGYYWNGAACVYLDACECVGPDCDKLTLTEAECQASHASCTEVPVISCGSSEMHAVVHEVCNAMDVSLVGECNCMLGFVWDGQACVALAGGCECVGYDCDKVSQTIEECQQAHVECV